MPGRERVMPLGGARNTPSRAAALPGPRLAPVFRPLRTPGSPQLDARSMRTWAFAVLAVGLAVAAHLTAGGSMPGLPQLLLLGVLVEAGAAAVARWRPGQVATAVTMGVVQVGLHGMLVLGGPSHGAAMVGHTAAGTRGMVVAHAGAALVLGVLLAHGERLLVAAARLLMPLALLDAYRPGRVRRAGAVVATVVVAAGRTTLRHPLTRRGPPPWPAAALS
jgi:hypothetical protein